MSFKLPFSFLVFSSVLSKNTVMRFVKSLNSSGEISLLIKRCQSCLISTASDEIDSDSGSAISTMSMVLFAAFAVISTT